VRGICSLRAFRTGYFQLVWFQKVKLCSHRDDPLIPLYSGGRQVIVLKMRL